MTFSKDKKTRFYKQRRISSLIKSGFACLTVTTQFLYPDEFTIANNNNRVNQKNLFFVYIFYILFIFVLHRGIVSYKKTENTDPLSPLHSSSEYFQKQKSTRCKSDAFVSVEATGFEPAASASRTQRSTKLSHASISVSRNSRLQGILYSFSPPLSILNFNFFSIFSLNSHGG